MSAPRLQVNLLVLAAELLGVAPNADREVIHRAYLTRAKQCHPDRGGDAEVFQAVKQAYLLLTDEPQRREYEQHRAAWLQARQAVDCLKCGAPNRVDPGAGMQCGRCNSPLSEWTPIGRLHVEGRRFAEGATVLGEEFLERSIDLVSEAGAEMGKELTHLTMGWLRARIGLKRRKEK